MQTAQSQSSDAIISLAAIITELARDPKKGFIRPLAQWQPWLQDEGYNSEGFDHLLSTIVPQDNQAHNFDVVCSAFYEAKNAEQSTFKFLLSLKHQYPDLFRLCFAELSTQLIALENINSMGGGKLTGPAATFIKKHPVVSTEMLAGGLATAWLLTELSLTHFGKQSIRAGIEESAINNVVDNSESSAVSNLAARASESGVPTDVILGNFEAHPEDFLSSNFPDLDKLKGHMLTKENADKFVALAIKGEEGALLSDEEYELLREVNAARLLYKTDNPNLEQLERVLAYRQEDLAELDTYLAKVETEDASWINELVSNYSTAKNLLTPNRLVKLRNQYAEIDNALDRIERRTNLINQINNKEFADDYEIFVQKKATPEQLNKAFVTLLGPDVKDNPEYQAMYANVEADFSDLQRNLDALIVADETLVLEDILADTVVESNALAKEFLSSEYDDLVAMFKDLEKGAKAEVENFIDDRI